MTTLPRLYKSDTHKIYKGVASGTGNYLGINQYIVRFLFILTSMYAGIGIILYYVLHQVLFTETEINMFLEQRRFEFINQGKLVEVEKIEALESKQNNKGIKVFYIAIILSVLIAMIYSLVFIRIYPWDIMNVEYQIASFVLLLLLVNVIIYFKNKNFS